MNDAPLVHTSLGDVRGERLLADGVPVARFLGIPYAAPPVGALRWRPPQPASPWTGVRAALCFGPDAPQPAQAFLRGPRQDEDCLFLNVWTPAEPPRAPLPVLVWIHGGGFTSGSGSDAHSDGARLCASGAVVVSFNYRTGLFGFLAHPALAKESEHGVSGNYGLLDQLAALRWIGANAAAFGGDPRRITVFGVSAGSASISLLLTSPHADGLFAQVALHSAGAGRPLATLDEAQRAGLALGADIAALRALPSAEVLHRTPLLQPAVRGLTSPRVLRPIHDGWLLPRQELDAYRSGRFAALPAIVGSNFDEGTLLTAAWPVRTREAFAALVRRDFGAAADEVLALYPAASDEAVRGRVAELFADTQFNFGTRLIARSLAARGQPAWRYLFTRRAPGQADGPHHGGEVDYVFGTLGQDAAPQDAELSCRMRAAWLAFARDGAPGSVGGQPWTPYDPARDNHLDFGDTVREGAGWRAAQLDFIDRFQAGSGRARLE